MFHWFLVFGIALAYAAPPLAEVRCRQIRAAAAPAPTVSAEVLLAFEDLAGADKEQILALAQKPRSQKIPETLLESAAEIMPSARGVDASRYQRDLETIYHIVSQLEIRGRALAEDEVELLTLHIASAAFDDAPPETIVREIPFDRRSEGQPAGRPGFRRVDVEPVVTQLKSAVTAVRPSEKRFKDLSEDARATIRAIIPTLLGSSLPTREYAHRHWIQHLLRGRAGLTEQETKRFMAWVDAAVLDLLRKEYAGEEGQLRFAKEFTRDLPFNAWIHMRTYVSFEDLKPLGWKSYKYGVTTEGIKEIRDLIRQDLKAFVETYHSEEGLKKLADEYFRGVTKAATQIVYSLLDPDQHYLLRWNEVDKFRYRILGKDGRLAEKYWGELGRRKLFREIALEQLQKSDAEFPSSAEYMTSEHLERLKKESNKVYERAQNRLPKAYQEMNWSTARVAISIPPDELARRYQGNEGQIRFAREHKHNMMKTAFSAAKDSLPPEKFAALGWRTSFENIDSAEAFPSTLFHADGSPRAEYLGRNGLIRYARKHKDGREFHARVGAAAHLTPAQFQALRWPGAYAREVSSESIAARIRGENGGEKAFFKGPTGFARYAALFHSGSDKRAMASATRFLAPESVLELGWKLEERQEPFEVRRILFTESLAMLVTEDGKVDAHYRGPAGLVRYLKEFPEATSQDALKYARTVLSPSELETLGWKALERRFRPAQGDRKFERDLSTRQREAVWRILAFHLEKGRFPSGSPDWKSIDIDENQFHGTGDFAAGGKRRREAIFLSSDSALAATRTVARATGLLSGETP